MDNTASDNKSHVCLVFGAALVEAGIFEGVTFSFLPVGHTHADIDQCFSLISRKLKRYTANSIPELRSTVLRSFLQNTYCDVLRRDDIVDFKRWLKDTFNKTAYQGSNGQHFFTYQTKYRDKNQDVILSSMEWCRQKNPIQSELLLELDFRKDIFLLGAATIDRAKIKKILEQMDDAKSVVPRQGDDGEATELRGQALRPTSRHPTSQTYQDWVDLLAIQEKVIETACQTCVDHAAARGLLGTSFRFTKEVNNTNKAAKATLDAAQVMHRAGDCETSAPLLESTEGILFSSIATLKPLYEQLLTCVKVLRPQKPICLRELEEPGW